MTFEHYQHGDRVALKPTSGYGSAGVAAWSEYDAGLSRHGTVYDDVIGSSGVQYLVHFDGHPRRCLVLVSGAHLQPVDLPFREQMLLR